MTQPDAIVQCAYDGCTNTWEPSTQHPEKKLCSRSCVAKQTHGRPVVLRTCKAADCDKAFPLLDHPNKQFCSRACVSRQRQLDGEGCANCGKGIVGRPPKVVGMPRYCDDACQKALNGSIKQRGDVPRQDPYAAVCCHCGRTAEYLLLSVAELRAMRPRPRCAVCGGAVWVEPMETTAHRVGDVSPGRTANPVAGWNYHEPVGEVTG